MMAQLIRHAKMMFVLLCIAFVSGTLSHSVIVSQDLPLLPLPPTPLPQQDAPSSIDGFRGVFPPDEQQPFTSSNTRLNPELAHEQSQSSLALSCEGVTSYDWCYALDFTMAGHGFTGESYTEGIGFHGPDAASTFGTYTRLYKDRASLIWGGTKDYKVSYMQVLYDFQPGENNNTDVFPPGIRLIGMVYPGTEKTLKRFDQPGTDQVGTWTNTTNIYFRSGIILDYLLSAYGPPNSNPNGVRNPDPIGSLTIKGIVIAGNNAYPPIVVQVPAAPPQCTFSPSNLNYSVRAEAHMNGTIIASVTDARTVHVLGKVSGEIPEPEGSYTYESNIWWLISFGERDSNQNLIPAGYVYSETVDEGSTCQGLAAVVPLREAVYIAPPPQYFVACSGPMIQVDEANIPVLDEYGNQQFWNLSMRSSPSFGEFSPNDNYIGKAIPVGDQIEFIGNAGGLQLHPSGTGQVQFAHIRYLGVEGYIARTIHTLYPLPNGTTYHYFTEGLDPACPQPPAPVDVAWLNPDRRVYYELYAAAAFWAIYNETSEASMEDDFSIVDSNVGAWIASRPHPLFYTVSGVPRLSSGFSDPSLDDLDRRDHRYLQARIILGNVPEFTTTDVLAVNGDDMYSLGFGYLSRWTIFLNQGQNPPWGHSDECAIESGGAYKVFILTANAKAKLDWLHKYMVCRLKLKSSEPYEPIEPTFTAAHAKIWKYVQLALEDHLAGLQNPIPLPRRIWENTSGQSQVKKANTCFVDNGRRPETDPLYIRSACNESGIDAAILCSQPGRQCRDVSIGPDHYDEFQVGDAAKVTVADWLAGTIPAEYTAVTNPYYIQSPSRMKTQLVYSTEMGKRYYVSVGQYSNTVAGPIDASNTQDQVRPRFMLLGLAEVPIAGDTLQDAFTRHWSRLNYRGATVLPQTFRPSQCMNGLSHVVWTTGNKKRWLTFTYQLGNKRDPNSNWFCVTG